MSPHPFPTLPAESFNDIAATRYGPMLFNRHDQYIGPSLRQYGEYSQGEVDLFAKLIGPGAVVVEGGSNIGAHTVALSRLVGPTGTVVAFEPQRLTFQTLCANLALNSCANVHAFQAGLGSVTAEIVAMQLAPDKPQNFGGIPIIADGRGERTPIRALDDLAFAACRLIKLDIEGMEVQALEGAAQTIKTHRPFLYVENDRKASSDALISLILRWDYRLYAHVTPLFSPSNHAGFTEDLFGNIASFNAFCAPREHGLEVTDAPEITSPDMWTWPLMG